MQARASSLPTSAVERALGVALFAPSASVLGIAAWLTPDPRGFGTHTQLGLGQCTFLHFTGYPCPMCGMTTTFTLMAHARPLEALLNQPFGVVLFALTVLAGAVGAADAVSGSGLAGRVWRPVLLHERAFAAALLAGMLLGWVYKVLLMHPELRP